MGSKKPKKLEDTIIVAGHPRSGTSLACQLVESAGIEFPSDFEGDEYNKEGYYEMELSKRVSKDLMKNAMTDENIEELNKVIKRLNNTKNTSGLKIVRTPAIFFYRHLTDNLKAVLIYRNPSDSKASMYRRGISQFPVSWKENNNALIAAYENIENSIIISYESLFKQETEKKFKELGLNVDMGIVDPKQRTQKKSEVVTSQKEEKIYKTLQKLEETDEEKSDLKGRISDLKQKGKL